MPVLSVTEGLSDLDDQNSRVLSDISYSYIINKLCYYIRQCSISKDQLIEDESSIVVRLGCEELRRPHPHSKCSQQGIGKIK